MGRAKRPAKRAQGRGLMAPALGMVAGVALLGLAGGVWVLSGVYGPGPRAKLGDQTEITLKRGQGVIALTKTLKEQGLIRDTLTFRLAARLKGEDKPLMAGDYAIPSGASAMQILDRLHKGDVILRVVTVPEGKTSAMVVRILMAEPLLTGKVKTPEEGVILPDTYAFDRGESRQAVLDRMIAAQNALMQDLWPKRDHTIPIKTPKEAIILASVVEKETGLAHERPQVAAVFVNRLRLGMRLQSDPTVVYGVSKGEPLGRGLRQSELTTSTPWNTYTVNGLPQTAIANPGRAAIEAVLNPPKSNDLFFVADGTGGHAFAVTYEEHKQNVARWRVIEAKAAQSAAKANGN